MLKKIAVILAILVLLFVGVMAALPDRFAVRSSVEVESPSAPVLAYVSDLRHWPEWWTIWAGEGGQQPEIPFRFSDETKGVGSTMSWEHETGNGEITVTKIDPDLGLFFDLDFDGMPTCECQLGLLEKDRGLLSISLSLEGDIPYFARLFASATEAEMSRRFDRSLKQLATRFDVDK